VEEVTTSETSVCYNETARCNIPECSNLHTRRHENLKSHKETIFSCLTSSRFVQALVGMPGTREVSASSIGHGDESLKFAITWLALVFITGKAPSSNLVPEI
jgi:hypothetical protein